MTLYYRLFLILISGLLAFTVTSCTNQEEKDLTSKFEECEPGKITISHEVAGMNSWAVSTRADNKTEEEKRINTLLLFIFDNDGNYMWHKEGTVGNILIDKNWFTGEQPRNKAKICLLANFSQPVQSIRSYNELMKTVTSFEGHNGIPKAGLPFYGEETHDLTPTQETGKGEVISIQLRALVARIDFEIYVENSDLTGKYDPTFQILNYELHYLPSGAEIGESQGETTHNNLKHYGGLVPPSSNIIFPESEPLKFHFYMPEHKRTKVEFKYPDNITENAKQRYKPMLAKDDAAYVLLTGTFSDHQGVEHVVSYKIYLGANHTDNFEVIRNKQYKNSITIKSIMNHDGAEEESISMDHRVNVSQDQFLVSLLRYSNLDCHIEVRPMDIYLTGKGSVLVEIEDPEKNYWVRMEHNSKGGGEYCTTPPHTGKRLYFTNDLVTNTISKNHSTEITSNDNNRVWFYFDENTKVSKDGMRSAVLKLTFIHENGKKDEPILYTFKQHDMYPVTYEGRTYYMEYYEEYLYNLDPKDGFGDTTDGMKWEQVTDTTIRFSTKEGAIKITQGTLHNSDNILGKIGLYYDFENIPNSENKHHRGDIYTQKLITAKEEYILPLESKPRSAAEYCYNKNKRNSHGTIDYAKWYLPGTDEIEDIVRGAYTDFQDFQNKYYWSSQPAYQNNIIFFEKHGNSGDAWGTFLSDDNKYARCAKINYENNQYKLITSETKGSPHRYNAINSPGNQKPVGPILTGEKLERDEGNQLRSSINRVRAIYKK